MELTDGRTGGRADGRTFGAVLLLAIALSAPLSGQDTTAVRFTNDSITVRFVETDLRAVIQALGRYLSKPVLVGNVQPVRVSLETPGPVDRVTLVALLKGLVESQSLDFTEDSSFFRVGPRAPDRPTAGPPGGGGPGGQGTAAGQLFVVRLKHARASAVAATLNHLSGAGGAFSGRAGLSTGTLSSAQRR